MPQLGSGRMWGVAAGRQLRCGEVAAGGLRRRLVNSGESTRTGWTRFFLDFSNRRAAMKAKYLGDLFPASAFAAPGVLYRDFFRTDRNGVEKGVVLIDLGSLP